MGSSSWWHPEAEHWNKRTAVLVAIAMGVLVAVVGLLVAVMQAHGGEASSNFPASGRELTATAAPLPSVPTEMCSPDSEGTVIDGWGPDRPVYHDDTFPNALTFNSTSDNPNIGDERGFVGIKLASSSEGVWSNSVEVAPDEEYLVRAYVRLDGPVTHPALDTKLVFNLPTCTAHRIAVSGSLSADGVYPSQIWDGASFWSRRDFNLFLVPDSAVQFGNAHPNGFALSTNELVTSKGVRLRSEDRDGEVKPGYAHALYVTFKVKAQVAPN